MRWYMLCTLAMCFALWTDTSSVALAHGPAVWEGEIDGFPVWITVVPRGHGISDQAREGAPWWQWGNATTDAYIFAFGHPQNVRIILAFEELPSGLPQASIYANNLGRELIEYSLDGDELYVLSSNGFPYITMRPEGAGWLVDGKTNYQLTASVDGPLPGREGAGYPKVQTDGVVDSVIQVGSEQHGVPKWQILRVANDPCPDCIYPRFAATERLPEAPPFQVVTPTIPSFPHLGIIGRPINYFVENRPPFYFNLGSMELEMFLFVGLQSGLYAVNSFRSPPWVDFEAPFVWYNLDSSSRYPQLVARAWYYPSGDPVLSAYGSPTAFSSFRYSWKNSDEERWAYSLQVAGLFSYAKEIEIGDTKVWGVPADELPEWIVTQPWHVSTFVEPVEGYPGGEGIYYYSTQTHELLAWLSGVTDELPSALTEPLLNETAGEMYSSLPEGFRGEYNILHPRAPELYFSPVDNRLHLLYAQGGVWNLGDGRVLRMHNLDGDAHIDGWTREIMASAAGEVSEVRAVPGLVEEALYTVDGFMVYSGEEVCGWRITQQALANFEIRPPTDQVTWTEFREQTALLHANEGRDPEDLRAWFNAFDGRSLVITRGKIRGVRATEAGFRFILELTSGFQVQGFSELDLDSFEPGTYVVSYDHEFTVQPFLPSRVRITPGTIQLTHPNPTALEPLQIQARFENAGLEDLSDLRVQIHVQGPETPSRIVAVRRASLLAQQSIPLSFDWTPLRPGQWKISLLWWSGTEGPSTSTAAKTSFHVDVQAPKPPDVREVWRLSNVSTPLPLVLFLVCLSVSAAGRALVWVRTARSDK